MTYLNPGYPHTLQTELKVLKLYKQNIPIKTICKMTNVSKDYPTKVAKKHNISRGSGKNSDIPYNIFTNNTNNSNYWLGYLISDGNLSTNEAKRIARISIATIDLEIVDKFKLFCPLVNHHKQSESLNVLYFSSKEVVKDIQKVGITPNKSKTIKLLIPLNNHILRGIFDGDGSVHNKRAYAKITTASKDLGNQIVMFLRENNIYSILRLRLRTNTYDVWIERRNDFKKFFELLYKNASSEVYMERKYNKFINTLKINNLI